MSETKKKKAAILIAKEDKLFHFMGEVRRLKAGEPIDEFCKKNMNQITLKSWFVDSESDEGKAVIFNAKKTEEKKVKK